jgi:hypothetical protein
MMLQIEVWCVSTRLRCDSGYIPPRSTSRCCRRSTWWTQPCSLSKSWATATANKTGAFSKTEATFRGRGQLLTTNASRSPVSRHRLSFLFCRSVRDYLIVWAMSRLRHGQINDVPSSTDGRWKLHTYEVKSWAPMGERTPANLNSLDIVRYIKYGHGKIPIYRWFSHWNANW